MAKQIGAKPGDQLKAIDSNGNTHMVSYDDVAPEANNRVDIYDPHGSEKAGEPYQIQSISKYTPPAQTSEEVAQTPVQSQSENVNYNQQ